MKRTREDYLRESKECEQATEEVVKNWCNCFNLGKLFGYREHMDVLATQALGQASEAEYMSLHKAESVGEMAQWSAWAKEWRKLGEKYNHFVKIMDERLSEMRPPSRWETCDITGEPVEDTCTRWSGWHSILR